MNSKLESFLTYLNSPFPLNIKKWFKIVFACSFVAIFMVLFKPSILISNSNYPNLILLGYGLASFIACIINYFGYYFLFPRFYNPEKWTVLRQYISQVIILITVTTINYAYSLLFTNFENNGTNGFFMMLILTFSVAIFLFIGFNMISYNIHFKKSIENINQINSLLKKKSIVKQKEIETNICIKSETNNIELEIIPESLIYIETDGNYLNVFYLYAGAVVKKTIRNTIKNVEDNISQYSSIMRCHRAYIINLKHVNNIDGNAQGYKLDIKATDSKIPVSRNYIQEFKTRMKQLKGLED